MERDGSPCEKHIAQGDQDTSRPKVRKERGCFDKFLVLLMCGKYGNLLKQGNSIEIDDLSGISRIDLNACVEEFFDGWKKEGELEEKYGRRGPGIRLIRVLLLRCFIRFQLVIVCFELLMSAAALLWSYYLYKIIKLLIHVNNVKDQGGDVDWTKFLRTIIIAAVICFVQYFGGWALSSIAGIVSASFRSALLLSTSRFTLDVKGSGRINASQISNIISGQLEVVLELLNGATNIISLPLHVIGIIGLGIHFAGLVFIAAIAFAFFTAIVIPYVLVNFFQNYNDLAVRAQDDRTKLTYQTISSAIQMKVCSWEDNRAEEIKKIRAREHNALIHKYLTYAYIPSIANMASMCSVGMLMIIFVFHDPDKLNLQLSLVCVQLVMDFLSSMYALTYLVLITGFNAWTSIKTLDNLYRLESVTNVTSIEHDKALPPEHSQIKGLKRISLQGNFCRWPISAGEGLEAERPDDYFFLKDIDIEVFDGELLCILGPTGSGKTLLLMAMLQEAAKCLPSSTKEHFGYHHPIVGSVAYAGQEPWIYTGTIRENITFGSDFDSKRFNMVIRECGLEPDLKELRYGDRTLVGSRGIKLSGGQKSRVGLARLAYKDADVYLLDDPFSSLDSTTGRKIYDNLIHGVLRYKTCVLVTNHLSYFKNDEKIIVMGKDGAVQAVGTRADVQKTSYGETMPLPSCIDFEIDEPREGIKHHMWSYLKSSLSMLKEEEPDSDGETPEIVPSQDSNFQMPITSFWFRAFSWKGFILSSCLAIIPAANDVVFPVYIAWWTSNPTRVSSITKWLLGLLVMVIISSFFISYYRRVFYRYKLKDNSVLHDKMADAVVRAPITFFGDNATGTILSRFTRDMSVMDKLLPGLIDRVLMFTEGMVIGFVMVLFVNFSLFVPIVIVISNCIYLLLRIVRPAMVRVKVMEATLLPYVQANMIESMEGVLTIRAFGAKGYRNSGLQHFLYDWLNAYMALVEINQWIRLRLAFVSFIIMTAILLGTFVLLHHDSDNLSPAMLSVVIMIYHQASLTLFHWALGLLQLEYLSIPVERVIDYIKTEPEAAWYSPEGKGPPDNWPSKGKISVVNLWAHYKTDLPYVLCGMSFGIHPGTTVGTVGRTGSGKSSFVKTLFRILEYDSSRGYIEIDGIKTCDIGLHELRPRMSTISQDPLLFADTIRCNMDPSGKASDVEIWKALEIVNLKECIDSLDTEIMNENCDTLSLGEKQLFCCARALLNKSAIYVMDEATAFLDPETDLSISARIKEHLKNTTVIQVAHRLHTIITADTVLVMEAGKVVEYGCPHELLQDKDGEFTKMVTNTGALNELKTAAREGLGVGRVTAKC